ncbi:hypothetical protein DKT77_16235 [Meridianimarinicoccus roseus]|uniref:DNA breaking-rejoining protein n=1 Tax=Meridianimarinicoccus roseus TaxID=2072018 RepID=A0A2V2LD19_9RHOB|nr:hypothetical protein [Meridianimarinicoccus roseus]PWR01671.1 hypothetical protein DKT77_16235 [Meridianimarinicoccus roseus]
MKARSERRAATGRLRSRPAAILCACLALSLPGPAPAQERAAIRFATGANSATVADALNGRDYRDYVLVARQGQTLSFTLEATGGDGHGSVYANVLPPGSDGVAILVGSSLPDGNGSVVLPESGDYVLRVYLMGNDRDAAKTVEYVLEPRIE